jgi:hypothetical protein
VRVPVPALHMPARHMPARHIPALHIPARHIPARHVPGPATVLLGLVYAAAIAVALTAPAEHALAGCLVLAGVTARWAVHRRRSTVGAVAASAAAVDALLRGDGALLAGDGGLVDVPAPAPAAAA